MNDDLGATVFFCTPERVTVAELERRQRADAEQRQRADAERDCAARVGPTQPPFPSAPAPPPACAAAPLPDCPHPHCPCRKELLELRQQAGYWKTMHQRACRREKALRAQIEQLQAKLRQREQQLFGRK